MSDVTVSDEIAFARLRLERFLETSSDLGPGDWVAEITPEQRKFLLAAVESLRVGGRKATEMEKQNAAMKDRLNEYHAVIRSMGAIAREFAA